MSNLKFSDKKVYIVLGIFLVLAIFLWQQVLASPGNNLKVTFYDVGQGDAIHIREGNQDVLIDGGPDDTIVSKLDSSLPFYDHKIELMILTHPHADHITGLVDVLNEFEVEQILYSGVDYSSDIYEQWKNIIAEKDIPLKSAKRGQVIKLNNSLLSILFPKEGEKEVKNINNLSVVARLAHGQVSFLFTGDAEKEVEKELISANISLNSDVLKVGHHGSKTATTKEFLAQVSPLYAVISAGEGNKFGHPHKETLDSLESSEVGILRTDVSQDIECVSDGEKVECN